MIFCSSWFEASEVKQNIQDHFEMFAATTYGVTGGIFCNHFDLKKPVYLGSIEHFV